MSDLLAAPPAGWEVRPLSAALGAVVTGADLAGEVSDSQWAAIDRLFAEHLVLVFPGQELSATRHTQLGRHFGTPYVHPHLDSVAGHPPLLTVVKEADAEATFGGEFWHCDISFESPPAAVSLLYSLEVPAIGGDTLFANQYTAYERLSDGYKQLLDGLHAHHTYPGMSETDPHAHALHPVVRRHPVTGRRALFVNPAFVSRIDGMTEAESAAVLSFLFEHQVRPEFQARVSWTAGQLVVWDNRATLHYAMNDHHGARRELRRLTAMEVQ